MNVPSRSLLFFLALALVAAVACMALATLAPSHSQAQAGTLTVELARSPGQNGSVAGYGKWLATGSDCYHGCVGWCEDEYSPYNPAGPWTQPLYDDSAWTGQTHVYWTRIWDDENWSPIPSIGKHVANSRSPDMDDGHTDLHRRWFYLPQQPGYELDHIHMWLFSDNHSEWYVNGTFFYHSAAHFAYEVNIDDVSGLYVGANNLLAVSVANNNVCSPHCNPHGIQYVVEAVYVPLPTPTPYVQAYARNPQGVAVNVAGMGRSHFDLGGPGSASFYSNRSSYTGMVPDYAGYDYRGAFFRSYGNQVLMGVTPSPGGVPWPSGATDLYYGWPNWYSGRRSVVAIYATTTPTPTPTPTKTPTPAPRLNVYVRNPRGSLVPQTVCKTRFNATGSPSTYGCVFSAFYPTTPLAYGSYAYRGARIAPSRNNVVVGVTPIPAGGIRRDVSGATVYGWSNWNTGARSITFIVATPTPTPSPTPTHTPSPTPTNTPTPTPSNTPTSTPTNTPTSTPTNTPTTTPTPKPYVLPPTIRPFLHLRGHEPPYTTQQIDYLATDDVYYRAQVYLHAVPAAEIVTPPQYCEWGGSGWTCTPADTFEWTGYTFHGVRREGYWFPSPAGDVDKPYSSPDHPFDPNPRTTDPDYTWPAEFLHLYFNLPAGITPPCPVTGPDGPCLVYDDRAPGEEILIATLHGRATWNAQGHDEPFDLEAEYPITLTATQWEIP